MHAFRFKRLAYVALNVTDAERTAAFLRDIAGLADGAPAGPGMRFVRCSAHHHDIALYTAAAPGLRRVAFEMESPRDLELLRAHLQNIGRAPVDVPAAEARALGVEAALRCTEPHSGLTLEFLTGMTTLASAYTPTHTKLVRLGHTVLGATDYRGAIDFFTSQLNFQVSDAVDEMVTFMRCFPNPLHHSFGVSAAPENRLHHVNFMVTDIDDIGRALYRLKQHDIPIVYGPGRHPPSGSVFVYFLDHDGITWEFSFGMEEFPEHAPRAPRLLPKGRDSLDYWGSIPDPRFASVGRIVADSALR